MNPIYTYRPFIHRERTDIDAYLEESQLWTDIYEMFINIKDNGYNLKVPSIKMFNEVHYQCVRLMLDPHPEENIWANYLNPAKESLGWRYASDLCFSLVYVVLSFVKKPPPQIPRFLRLLKEKKMKTEEWYFPYCKNFVFNTRGRNYEVSLKPCPEKPDKIYYMYGDTFSWQEATCDFDQERIRDIVRLWKTKEEQLEVLQLIENNFTWEQQHPTSFLSVDELPF